MEQLLRDTQALEAIKTQACDAADAGLAIAKKEHDEIAKALAMIRPASTPSQGPSASTCADGATVADANSTTSASNAAQGDAVAHLTMEHIIANAEALLALKAQAVTAAEAALTKATEELTQAKQAVVAFRSAAATIGAARQTEVTTTAAAASSATDRAVLATKTCRQVDADSDCALALTSIKSQLAAEVKVGTEHAHEEADDSDGESGATVVSPVLIMNSQSYAAAMEAEKARLEQELRKLHFRGRRLKQGRSLEVYVQKLREKVAMEVRNTKLRTVRGGKTKIMSKRPRLASAKDSGGDSRSSTQ